MYIIRFIIEFFIVLIVMFVYTDGASILKDVDL